MDTQGQRTSELDAIVAQFDLNRHPFYVEWRAGTLPKAKLQSYAFQYGHFIGTIDEGWDTLGEREYAKEERVHEGLWESFRTEIGSEPGQVSAATHTLVTAAANSFRTRPEAIGALYAFEAQQPNTSKSKLEGLSDHYEISDVGSEYFKVHADDFAEAESLRVHTASLTDSEFERAKGACSVVCSSMWHALDSVYYN